MGKIVPIVEGDGEVTAVPPLLTRALGVLGIYDLYVAGVKNAHGRDNLLKDGGIERFVRHALGERDCVAVFIVLDGEGDCPRALACQLVARVRALAPTRPVAIVVANRMYENWILASIQTVAGKCLGDRVGLNASAEVEGDPEEIRNAKSQITRFFPQGRAYKETLDQHSLTQLIDFPLARTNSRSFRRMIAAVQELAVAAQAGEASVSPTRC